MPPVTYRLGGVERLISVEHYRRAAPQGAAAEG
jgi:hypothetical protein